MKPRPARDARWDQAAAEPQEYPDGGEPEGYILDRPHDLAERIGPLWEVLLPGAGERADARGPRPFYIPILEFYSNNPSPGRREVPEGHVRDRLSALAESGVTTLTVRPLAPDQAARVRLVEHLRTLIDQL